MSSRFQQLYEEKVTLQEMIEDYPRHLRLRLTEIETRIKSDQ